MNWIKKTLPVWLVTLVSCGGDPLPTVEQLELERYMGTWYEIARFPHRFEKNLQCVSATYSLREDGKVTVYNRGFSTTKGRFTDITGKAWVPDSKLPGEIRVSFFGPFAGDYFVMELAEDYSYALVGAPSRNYLWILARQTELAPETYDALVAKARQLGFDTDRLETVRHDCE